MHRQRFTFSILKNITFETMNNRGITLVTLIIVVGIILILGDSAFVWLDPAAKIGRAKDVRRKQDILFGV